MLLPLATTCFWTYFLSMFDAAESNRNNEFKLREQLMNNYHKLSRPVVNHSATVNVTFDTQLYQLLGFNIDLQTLTTLVWQKVLWKDEFLQWNRSDVEFEDIDVLRFWEEDIWLPDILPFNDVGNEDVRKYKSTIPVKVFYNGDVVWAKPILFETTCAMDVTDFPFDKQTCWVEVGSWQYGVTELDVWCDKPVIDTKHYVPHSQWQLLGTSCERSEYESVVNKFSLVSFKFEFRRLHSFFILNLILPNAILLALSTLTFFVSASFGDRMGFGVTVTLSLCVNLITVINFIPQTSKTIPKLCHYFLASIFLSGFTILFSTFSMNVQLILSEQKSALSGLSLFVKKTARKKNTEQLSMSNNTVTHIQQDSLPVCADISLSSSIDEHTVTSSMNKCSHNQKETLEESESENIDLVNAAKMVDRIVGLLYFIGTTVFTIIFLSHDK